MVCDNPKAFALKRAARFDIPVCLISPKLFSARADYEKLIARILKSQKIDCVILAGFMRIFTPYFIRPFKNRILNIHPSLLPHFKGAHAIRDAFEARVPETGVTVHLVTMKVDAGPILYQEKVKVLPKDTLESLAAKIHAVEHRVYPRVIQKFLRSNQQN